MPRFFGEFLVANGEVDEGHIQEALTLCERVNVRVGDIARHEGWLDGTQICEVLERQRTIDRRFGEIAISLGYLSESQLQTLVHRRTTTHLYIGEALVQLGVLSTEDLSQALERYKAEVAEFSERDQVPMEVMGNAVAAEILGALPRISARVGGIQILTHWAPEWCEDPELPLRSWIRVESERPLVVGIAASTALAESLAAGMLICEPSNLSRDDVEGALGKYLNLLVGSTGNNIPQECETIRISPPQTEDFPDQGFGLRLVTNRGPGCLLLQTAFSGD